MPLVDKSCQSTVYITPDYILDPVRSYFGGKILMDPATEPDNPTLAHEFYTKEHNGLVSDWGRAGIFVNPPYGKELALWTQAIWLHGRAGAEIVALLPGQRFETAYWQQNILSVPLRAICFLRKRVSFLRPDGTKAKGNPYGSMLYGFNVNLERFSIAFRHLGKCVEFQLL